MEQPIGIEVPNLPALVFDGEKTRNRGKGFYTLTKGGECRPKRNGKDY
jgi:hypothetical protein